MLPLQSSNKTAALIALFAAQKEPLRSRVHIPCFSGIRYRSTGTGPWLKNAPAYRPSAGIRLIWFMFFNGGPLSLSRAPVRQTCPSTLDCRHDQPRPPQIRCSFPEIFRVSVRIFVPACLAEASAKASPPLQRGSQKIGEWVRTCLSGNSLVS